MGGSGQCENYTNDTLPKMRELYDAGITKPAEIAKLVDAHYSIVYTVLSKYKKNEKLSE